MSEELAVATPPDASVSPQNGEPQATEPNPQGSAQPQEPGSVPVDNGQQPTSSNDAGRPKPSEFWKIRQLEKTIRDMQQQMGNLAKPQSPAAQLAPNPDQELEEFWKNPTSYTRKAAKEALEDLKKEIPQIFSQYTESEKKEQRKREALDLLFPKSSPESRETLEQRVQQNLQRTEQIMQIFEENGLDVLAETQPVKAANLALKIFESEQKKQPARNPLAPTKGQMASTATATPIGGKKPMSNVTELLNELKGLTEKAGENPNLFSDPQHQQKVALVRQKLEEARKGQ